MHQGSPEAAKPTQHFATAYYLVPPVWVTAPPGGEGSLTWVPPQTSLSPTDLKRVADEVYRKDLRCGISVAVLREGLFVFDFSKWAATEGFPQAQAIEHSGEGALERTALLNTHLACLYTAVRSVQPTGMPKMVLSPGDLFSVEFSPPYLGGIPGTDPRWTWLALSRFADTYSQSLPPGLDFRMISRHVVLTTETIEKSMELLTQALEGEASRIVSVSDLYLRSCKAGEEHNYGLSTVLSWTACERLLNVLWERYIEERDTENSGPGMRFVSRKRKEKLTGVDFTASVVTELLSLADHIDFPLYENLNTIRKARNGWVHGGDRAITIDAALLGLQVTGDMIQLVDSIPIRLSASPMGYFSP
jgi:hypothetical protein